MPSTAVLPARPVIAATPAWQPCGAIAVAAADPMPGQFWLVEVAGDGRPLPHRARRALVRADVVIYDRAVAPAVAALLPAGTYAEAAAGADPDADIERCLRFATEGWSVLRLVCGGDGLARRLAAQLGATARVRQVTLFAETDDGACTGVDVPVDRLADTVAAYRGHGRLSIVAGTAGGAPRLYAVAANGLAG